MINVYPMFSLEIIKRQIWKTLKKMRHTRSSKLSSHKYKVQNNNNNKRPCSFFLSQTTINNGHGQRFIFLSATFKISVIIIFIWTLLLGYGKLTTIISCVPFEWLFITFCYNLRLIWVWIAKQHFFKVKRSSRFATILISNFEL